MTPRSLEEEGASLTGNPIPAALDGARQFDFMWGVLLAP